jgi:fatty-acyl-CoA synthase
MTGFLAVPMYFGAELVKVTPLDFLRDALLWAKLIDKYKGTMTAPNFAYNLLARRLRQAEPGQFDLSSLRWPLSGAEQVDPADVEELCAAGARFGLKAEAIVPAYGMAETTVAVSFSACGAGTLVDQIDADLLAVLRRAVPATRGNLRRVVCLGEPLPGVEVRIVDDDDGAVLPARGVGVIQVRGGPVADGYTTMAGFVSAQDDEGWYDTGDLGYVTQDGQIAVCGRVKDVIIMAGRNIYPTDIERAAARVEGVRPGCAVAVRLDPGCRTNPSRSPSRPKPMKTMMRYCGSGVRWPMKFSPTSTFDPVALSCSRLEPSRRRPRENYDAPSRSHLSPRQHRLSPRKEGRRHTPARDCAY